jgi:hypothetical protein
MPPTDHRGRTKSPAARLVRLELRVITWLERPRSAPLRVDWLRRFNLGRREMGKRSDQKEKQVAPVVDWLRAMARLLGRVAARKSRMPDHRDGAPDGHLGRRKGVKSDDV